MRTRSRQLAVLLFDEVELLDFAGAVEVLSVAGRHYNFRPFKVKTVAKTAGLVETRNQLRVQADLGLAECTEADVILVPGGYGARRALTDPELVAWLETRGRAAELLLSVGYGGLLLAKAGFCHRVELAVPEDVRELAAEIAPEVRLSGREIALAPALMSAEKSAQSPALAVHAVRHFFGDKFANQVANRLGVSITVTAAPAQPVRIVEPER